MSLIITLLRNLVGSIIVLIDLITRGTKLKRTPQEQQQVESELKDLTLYQFFACPFCIKTRRKMYKLNLPIEKRSVSKGSVYREELAEGGGKVQTPCLRIQNKDELIWLYESSAIISYLEKRFA
jgi:glutaredoxin